MCFTFFSEDSSLKSELFIEFLKVFVSNNGGNGVFEMDDEGGV